MANANNIYLRVPTVLAQFYRHREVKHPLTEFDAVRFSPFQGEHILMSNFLQIDVGGDINHAGCFSQRAWRNILQGRQPSGGKRIINRDETEWPTMQEVCMLTNDKKVQRMDGYDYVCIEMPKEVLVGRQYKPTNGSYSLPPSAAVSMVSLMQNFFKFTLLDWVRQERHFCNIHGVSLKDRHLTMMIDHFFYYYDICMGTNFKDRDSMRRMAIRWIEESAMLPNDGVDFADAEDLHYVYESEEANADIEIRELLKQLKVAVKKS